MKNIELLAPVGSYEALIASIQNGANAVYLSGSDFGARKFAKNFDREEMVKAIEYAHIRDVKVYVTVNTLLKDAEWDAVTAYIDFLYINDVDAIIVQDMGIANFIRTTYPDLDMHASTQMSAHSVHDVEFLKNYGFKRVVVAREMSIDEIKTIKETIDVELEVFVHGALCVSYSGQCLMSSIIGGRSGNRGRCAQPCRQLYTFGNQKNYALSPKDLNGINAVAGLMKIGVDALKIEGRMKGPEYAATVVHAYRGAIDGGGDAAPLNRIFNRSYTKGFLMKDESIIANDAPGNRGEYIGTVHSYDAQNEKLTIVLEKMLNKGDEIQIRRQESSVGARADVFYLQGKRVKKFKIEDLISVDFKYAAKPGEKIYRTYDVEIMDGAKQSYLKEFKKTLISGFVSIHEGQSIYLSLTDNLGNKVDGMSDDVVEKAINVPLDEARVTKQLSKLGQTSYELFECEIDLEKGVSVPAKALNDVRRICTDQLDALRKNRYNRSSKLQTEPTIEHNKVAVPKIAVSVRNAEQLEALEGLNIETIYYSNLDDLRTDVIPRLFRITPEDEIDQMAKKLATYDGPLLVGNLGQVKVFKDHKLITDYSMNVINSKSIQAFSEMSIDRITLSYEMAKENVKAINVAEDQAVEMIVYGYVPVMVMAYCPITQKNMHCDNCAEACKNNQVLRDRFDEDYPMMRTGNRIEILSTKRLHLLSVLNDFSFGAVDIFRLDFSIETPEEVIEITQAYINKVEGEFSSLDLDNVTKGHYFHGIE